MDPKTYIPLIMTGKETIESVVYSLIDKEEETGDLYSAKTNGVTLYSDTVTLEKAYKDAMGVSKEEFYELMEV